MFSKGSSTKTLKELGITELDIANHFLGISRLPVLINNPLRVDENPSLGLYYKDNKVKWKDFGTKDTGDVYSLLMKIWKCSYHDVIERVKKEITASYNTSLSKTHGRKQIKVEKSELLCKIRRWEKHDIQYWQTYGVPLEYLKKAEVYPISHKIIRKGGKNYSFKADKYAYAFVERKEGNVTIKIYQPFNKGGYKWSNKNDKSVISLWSILPEKGDKVVICSSLKDALCLWANTGIPAIALQGEGYPISTTAANELKKRFKQVYILFDNDDTGLSDGRKLAGETGFKNIVLPIFKEGKDISDYYKAYGRENFKSVLLSLLDAKSDVS